MPKLHIYHNWSPYRLHIHTYRFTWAKYKDWRCGISATIMHHDFTLDIAWTNPNPSARY